MAAIYLDADVQPDFRLLVPIMRHDVLTTHDLQQLDASDAQQLVTATDLGRILVTHNGKDFRTLCIAWRVWRQIWGLEVSEHAGVIAIPQPISLPQAEAARLVDRLLAERLSLWNQLWYFDQRRGDWVQQV